MMPILIGAGLAIILAAVYVAFSMSRFRESAGAMEQTARELLTRLQSVEARLGETEDTLAKNLTAMRREQNETAAAGRAEQARNFAVLGDAQAKRVMEIGSVQRDSFQNFAKQLAEAMRSTVEEKLREMQKGNEEKLEKMRATVDEQLHATLEKRLGEAFASVSERLEQVHKGLGEMRALTSDVGDLKKVLSNVKARGTWGEMQLRALLEQMLTKEQYAENVETRPGSGQRVEFAVVLPGRGEGGATVYLPIDSKFPMEDYQRITAASERGDAAALTEAQKALRARVLDEAKAIHDKYIEPPHTTDFGILYLPIEGLYAEVLRLDGLCERISREYRVVPAGPTTVCALLNSLQMGFRTLAIEKRSSEVWVLLGKVKTEFEKFGVVLEKTREKIEAAGKELDNAGVRTRAINRALKNVQQLPLEGGEDFLSAGEDKAQQGKIF